MSTRHRRVLIIVQNLPVPLDRRVWLECLALRKAGVGVSVICPKGPGDPRRQTIAGVHIYKYTPPRAAGGFFGYLLEFVYCWLRTAVLSVEVAFRDGFGAIQACNPPDTYWALALLWRPFGKRFVYDQHDLNPEVFLSRFGEADRPARKFQFAVLKMLEAATYRVADHVISTNESYRAIALGRGRRQPDTVTVVRSGPDTVAMRPVETFIDARQGHEYLAVYLGIMGPQDGVDRALRAFAEVVHSYGRTDCHFALLGFGDCLDELKSLAKELRVDDHVTFTGRVDRSEIADYLSAADVGICPDPKSPLNDVSTMNKTMEYMAYCVPIVSFDLLETRVSAGDAAIYVESEDVEGFAKAWIGLLDDPDDRVRRGLYARQRAAQEMDWAPQELKYVEVWEKVLGIDTAFTPEERSLTEDRDPQGRRYVDLDDESELSYCIRHRTVAELDHAPTGPGLPKAAF
jgi:glycosyltransferase involved in cell wall biosynthesis